MFNRGLSPRTIEYKNAVLQSAFSQAVRWKMLAEDPCVGVDLPPLKRCEMEALSVEECRRFLTAARETELYALFALALTTGMRPSEYLALKWSDIDWHRSTASVCRTIHTSSNAWTFYDTKRKRSRRVVKLENFVLEALDDLRSQRERGHDLVFHKVTAPETTKDQGLIPEASCGGWHKIDSLVRSSPHRRYIGPGGRRVR